MEPAGLGVGILTLFIECLRAYRVFANARHCESELNIIKTKIQIEETRLMQWGTYWGYQSDATNGALERNIRRAGHNVATTVSITLSQIFSLLKDSKTLCKNYDRIPAYQRVVWALHDKATLEATVRNLNDFNNGLHQLLPQRSEASLSQATACAIINSSEDTELDAVIMVMQGLHNIDAVKLAKIKRAYLRVSAEEQQQQSAGRLIPSLDLELDFASVKISTRYQSKDRTWGVHAGNPVLIEWTPYDPTMFNRSAADANTLKQRTAHLAELLCSRNPRPANFNVLTCAGYIDDLARQRHGLLYGFPRDVSPSMPLTLRSILLHEYMPDLGTRFRLAQSLATTVHLLHSSGWLHKSIRSGNIILFQNPGTNAPIFDTPYLGGFVFSRPDDTGAITFHERTLDSAEDHLYRHSEVQDPTTPRRSRASDDLYSLALVFLEIALWKPLVTIEGRADPSSRAPLNIQKVMGAVDALPLSMGRIYREAVLACLGPKQRTPFQSQALTLSTAEASAARLRDQNAFYWDVVRRLDECKA